MCFRVNKNQKQFNREQSSTSPKISQLLSLSIFLENFFQNAFGRSSELQAKVTFILPLNSKKSPLNPSSKAFAVIKT